MNFNSDMTIKDMLSEYKKSLGDSIRTTDTFIFLANGKQIDSNSLEKLGTTIKNDTKIIVIEFNNDDIDESKTIIKLDKINSNQFKRRHLRKFGQINNINEILGDMAVFGCLTIKIIDNTLSSGAKSFISVDEAIQQKDQDPQSFILGVFGKYLTNLGIKTVIERTKSENEKYNNLCNTVLQFVFNGLIFRKKYYLAFEYSEEKKLELLKNKKHQNDIKEKIRKAISELYLISPDDIIVTDPIKDNYYSLIVLFKDERISLTKEDLMKKFSFIAGLSYLKYVKKENIIEGLILNKCMLDYHGDNIGQKWPHFEKRGGEEYLPPNGWDRYGLNVYNKYDNQNNDWLSFDNRKGEWCIGYSWLNYGNNSIDLNKAYENDNDIKHNGKPVGRGIYCTQDPEIMEEYCEEININQEKYKLGLMLRVNPEKIRCPESKDDFWVVEGFSDEIRPYGILIQKIK